MSNPSPIPQTSPLAGYLAHQVEIDAAVQSVLSGQWYIRGPQTTEFEKNFASYLGVTDVHGVANGTDAIAIALRALGIGPGDSVITVSHTAVATVAAIEMVGARPILVDINPITYLMDPQYCREVLREASDLRIKVIIPVHLYGCPVDISPIRTICEAHGLFLIEDCAQAHGSAINGRKVGGWGDISTFSFYPTKNLGAIGDGGAVATNRIDLAEKTRMLSQYGWRQRYISEEIGVNSRLDELQAAILNVKLNYLDEENDRRREIAGQYQEALNGISEITLPEKHDGHVFHQYVIRTAKRDELREYLTSAGIGTLIHYPLPVHQQPAYKDRIYCYPNELSKTEQVCREIVSLPMFPQLSDQQVERVVGSIRAFFANK